MTRYEVELTDEQALAYEQTFSGDDSGGPCTQAAYALADAIRANLPKPPRMTEPAQGGLVVAGIHGPMSQRRRWFRMAHHGVGVAGGREWICEWGIRAAWSDLDDPEPVDGAS
jgi:hypothetical protein